MHARLLPRIATGVSRSYRNPWALRTTTTRWSSCAIDHANIVEIATDLAQQVGSTPLSKNGDNAALHMATERCREFCVGGSFALINLSEVADRYRLWTQHFPDVRVRYPVKVNPDSAILALVARMGGGFDVASTREIDAVLQQGADPDKIIFSHTMKTERDMHRARAAGVKFSIVDSVEEIDKHARVWPEAQLLLRIAPAREDWNLGHRFGVDVAEAGGLLQLAHMRGLSIVGVHFHVGSLAADSAVYIQAIKDARRVFDIARESGLSAMTYLNIGGGFHCATDRHIPTSKRDFLCLAQDVNRALRRHFPPASSEGEGAVEFLAEPGTFLSMSAVTVSTEVIGVRKGEYWLSDSTYGAMAVMKWPGYSDIAERSCSVVVRTGSGDDADASATATGGSAGGADAVRPARRHNHNRSPCAVQGVTCDWEDTIHRSLPLPPDLLIGDRVNFENMGAYAQACAADFNGYRLASMPAFYLHDPTPSRDGFHVAYAVKEVDGGKGWGVVATEEVRAGELVWQFGAEGETHVAYDEEAARAALARLATLGEKRFFLNHLFGWEGAVLELVGDCKFMNHSAEPSIATHDGKSWVALRDLKAGEEIVDNYGTFENPQWYVDLCKEFSVEWAGKVAELYS